MREESERLRKCRCFRAFVFIILNLPMWYYPTVIDIPYSDFALELQKWEERKKLQEVLFVNNRSTRSLMFFKIGVFKKFAGKHLCWSLFLIKLQAFMTATLLKLDLYYRETTTQCFLMNFVKLLRTPFWKMFWKNTSGRLLFKE